MQQSHANIPMNFSLTDVAVRNIYSHHEKVFLSGLRFKRYFSYHRATQFIMARIFKGYMRTFTETIKLTEKKKLPNVTN